MATPRPNPQFTIRAATGHFARDLRAASKSPRTVETNLEAVARFGSFAEARGLTSVGLSTPTRSAAG